MAGTPTTNYNIPTYADTDAPDLSGAYNDAMGIIDTQLKANADAIAAAGGAEYTGANGISVSGSTISGIEQNSVSVTEDAVTGDPGVVRYAGTKEVMQQVLDLNGQDMYKVQPSVRAVADYVAAHGGTAYTAGEGISLSDNVIKQVRAGSASTASGSLSIGALGGVHFAGNNASIVACINATSEGSDTYDPEAVVTVPNCFGLKDYVQTAMAAAGVAYTGTAPVVVDNGSHTISVSDSTPPNINTVDKTVTPGTNGVMNVITFSEQTPNTTVAAIVDGTDGWPDTAWGNPPLNRTTLNVRGIQRYVDAHTPDASTSVKGLVKLDTGGTNTENSADAITARGVVSLMGTLRNNVTSRVTVNDLANNLYYSTATGMLFYKPTA